MTVDQLQHMWMVYQHGVKFETEMRVNDNKIERRQMVNDNL